MNKQQKGFTIIELLIATLVFSVILIIITAGIISFTNQYYKGVTASTTQGTARAVIDAISQDIQLSSSGSSVTGTNSAPDNPSAGKPGYFCTGAHQYVYLTGHQLAAKDEPLEAHQSHNVFVQAPGNCSPTSTFPTVGGSRSIDSSVRELMGRNMRLAKLSVSQVAAPTASHDLWEIKVRVVSGSDDVLCRGDVPATCNGNQTMTPADYLTSELQCKPGKGSQFCSVAQLQTIVEKRLN